jgi:hypothetical protein
MEMSGQLHAHTALPRGKNSYYPLKKMVGEPQGHIDAIKKEKKSLAISGNRS